MSHALATVHDTADGAVLAVRVIPRARRTEITGIRNDAIVVRLNAPPVDNAANDALVALLAERLDLSRASIRILSGERGRLKRVAISGIGAARVLQALGLD